MKKYRIEIFINRDRLIRYFDSERDAMKAGNEAKRDGAHGVYLLVKRLPDVNKYEVVKQF